MLSAHTSSCLLTSSVCINCVLILLRTGKLISLAAGNVSYRQLITVSLRTFPQLKQLYQQLHLFPKGIPHPMTGKYKGMKRCKDMSSLP